MSNYLNRECDRIPKFRMEMTGRRGVEIWIDGVNISQGVRSVTFSAEGCEKSPVLNLSLDVGEFSFLPERNLIRNLERTGEKGTPPHRAAAGGRSLYLSDGDEHDDRHPERAAFFDPTHS